MNILMKKDTELVKNIMIMVKGNSKVNIYMEENGLGKDIIYLMKLYMN